MPKDRVIALHGTMWRDRCSSCGTTHECLPSTTTKRCSDCQQELVPDVILPGESLRLTMKQKIQLFSFIKKPRLDFLVICGTQLGFSDQLEIVERARKYGAFVINVNVKELPVFFDTSFGTLEVKHKRINPNKTLVDYFYREKASFAVPKLCAVLSKWMMTKKERKSEIHKLLVSALQ
jgi:NAD-dependent SIR2 family protein deacetylase